MRCPDCSAPDDKVVDSRASDDGTAIRRRRECLSCGHRFTTFERVDEAPLIVVKTTGERQPFDRDKVVAGVKAAAKNRPVTAEQVDALATGVEDSLRR
ncbi:MAG TPA: ATP cone domain-containing protein, partial [Iamia sp.]|nr:ATP cone domain-containing protein [Iamia sp.]